MFCFTGPINWFLSLQIWKLPARLSYAVYLIHMAVIFTGTGSWLKTYYYTEGNNVSVLEFACNCYPTNTKITIVEFFFLCLCA